MSTPSRVIASALALALVVSACAQPSEEAQAPKSRDVAVALPTMRGRISATIASGSTILASLDDRSRVSTDGGATWRRSPLAWSRGFGYRGTFVVPHRADEDGETRALLEVWKTGTAKRRVLDYNGDPVDDATDKVAITATGKLVDFSGKRAVERQLRFLPATYDYWDAHHEFSDDATTVLRMMTTGKGSYLSTAPVTGATGSAAVKVSGLRIARVIGSDVHYLQGSKTSLKLCRAKLSTLRTARCKSVASGDYRTREVSMTAVGSTLIVQVGPNRLYLVAGGKLHPIARPAGLVEWSVVDGDTARPLLNVTSKVTGTTLQQVLPDGSIAQVADGPVIPAEPDAAIMTTTRLYASDARPFTDSPHHPLWGRPLTTTTVGDEVRMPRPLPVLASTSRWITDHGKTLGVYDDGVHVRTITLGRKSETPQRLSGPYLHTWIESDPRALWRVDGTSIPVRLPEDIFGSLVLEWTSEHLGERKGTEPVWQVRDVARRGSTPIKVRPPGRGSSHYYQNAELWGDWILARFAKGDDWFILAYNYRTRKTVTRPDGFWAGYVGDGYALVYGVGPNDRDGIWDFATNTVIPLAKDEHPLATDGINRLALVKGGKTLVVRTYTHLGKSAPRLLGVIAPARYRPGSKPWRAQLDVTKGLKAGRLVIRDASGIVVRTVATPATDSGALRRIDWDGRNDDGARVAPGTYTWTLEAPAADKTGTVRSVDGLGPASGTVKVVR